MSPVINLKTGYATTEWYRYFSSPLIPDIDLSGVTTDNLKQGSNNLYFSNHLSYEATKEQLIPGQNVGIVFNDLQETITISSSSSNLVGIDSIQAQGSTLSGLWTLSLVNDVPSPSDTSFYGTSSTGMRGWQPMLSAFASTANIAASAATDGVVSFDLTPLSDTGLGTLLAITRDSYGRITGTRAATITGTAGRITVANGDASSGLPTLDLATVADAGGGALLRFVRDAWGRLSGTSAATTSDLAEGTNLYFTAARVLATILAGLSTATNAVITATDTVLGALGKLQAQITGNAAIPAGYIDGLNMVWNSATSISVTSGACYIQGSSAVISFPSTLTLSSLSLTASTFYHVYGYLNAGTPAIELVTTAPAAAYSGTACAKTGDTSRRYLGSVLTDSSGNIVPFQHSSNRISYLDGYGSAPYSVLSAGSATSSTSVSLSSYIPITANVAQLLYLNGSGITFNIQASTGSYVFASFSSLISGGRPGSNLQSVFDCPCPSQEVAYFYSASGGSLNLNVIGYTYQR